MITFESVGIDTKGKSGNRFYIPCPKCSADRKKSKIPCLTVNDEAGNRWWRCNHCTFHGNLESFEKFNKVRERAMMPATLSEIYSLHAMERLFIPKKISGKTALQAKIYEIPAFKGEEYSQVAFPYFFQGNLVNVKFRRLDYDKTIKLPNGNERYLSKNWQIPQTEGSKFCYWGLELLDFTHPDLTITEGETDTLTWREYDFKNILSIPNGAVNPDDKNIETKLAFATDDWIVTNIYRRFKNIYLALDDDPSGIRTRDELAKIIGKRFCHNITYGGRKDINEVSAGGRTKEGKELPPLGRQGVEDCFTAATPYPVGGIYTMRDILPKLNKRRVGEDRRGFLMNKDHNDRLNKLVSVKAPYLAVIGGRPSAGKTSIWRWMMMQYSMSNGCKWGLYMPDARPEEEEMEKLAEIFAGGSWQEGFPWSLSNEKKNRAVDFVHAHFFLIQPKEDEKELMNHLANGKLTSKGLDTLFFYLETLKRQHKIFGWCLDSWNKLEYHKPNGTNDEQFISKELDRVLKFNVEQDLFGSIIAHPTKLEKKKDGSGNYDAPDLYNVKGSSAWYEKADIGITAHREIFRHIKVGTEGFGNKTRDIKKWIVDKNVPTRIIVNKMKQRYLGEEGEELVYMDWKKGETFVYEKPDYFTDVQDDFLKKKEVDATPVDETVKIDPNTFTTDPPF